MKKNYIFKQAVYALVGVGALVLTGPALAAISGVDNELNGDFNASPLTYGTTGTAYLSALLFVGDFASALPPADQVLGTGLTYDYKVNGLGTSVVDIIYTISNTNPGATDFDAFHDLRFLVNVQIDGSFTFMDEVSAQWPVAPLKGDPDNFQIEDFGFGLKSAMQSAGAVNGANNCGSPCDADFGLQWNLPILEGGGAATWVIALRLVDDPSLITGDGRFLLGTSADTAGTQLYVGNPQVVPIPAAYGMLMGSLAMLGLLRTRSGRRG